MFNNPGVVLGPPDHWLLLVLGYAFAMFVPIPAFKDIASALWKHVAIEAGAPPDQAETGHRGDLPTYLGVIERFLYIMTILTGHAEFIGVWLVLKVAGGWKGWSDGQPVVYSEPQTTKVTLLGRDLLNASLIGSALSLVWAIAGATVIVWGRGSTLSALIAAATALGATYAFRWLLHDHLRRRIKRKTPPRGVA